MSGSGGATAGAGWRRLLVAVVVLVVLAGAYWPAAIDDSYISAAYAFELLARGELAWPGAARLEGYSDFLWVVMMALAARVGVDVILAAKIVSLVAGVALVGVVARNVPATRRGDLALAAVVLWMPLAYWSAMALETASYALVVVVGWLLVVEGRGGGLVLLLIASLVRFEGGLWWLVGAVVLLADGPRQSRRWPWVAGTAVALGGYHAWRIAYFGAWLPAAVHLKAGLGWSAALQLVEEAAVAAGLLAVAFLFRMPRQAWRSWIPPAIGASLLVAMNGDWMARGRLLMPGLVAMVVVRARWGEPRAISSRAMSVVLVLVVAASLFEPRYLERPRLRAWLPRYGEGLTTPLLEPVSYAIEHVPEGAVLASADVGLLGHVPAMSVVDTRGLVSPMFLRARRARDVSEVEAWWRSPDGPDVVEVSRYQPTDFIEGALEPHGGLDPWLRELDHLLEGYPYRRDVLYDEDTWRGAIRFHHREAPEVSRDVVARRWRGLAERFPAHPVLSERAELDRP